MQDSLNALQSYLDTLKDKGFSFLLSNYDNDYYQLIVHHTDTEETNGFTESSSQQGLSKMLEEVENYVESIIKKNEPIKN